jgi:Na+/proline symporter
MHNYLRVGHTLHEFIGEYYDRPGGRPIVRLTAAFLTLLVYWAALGIEFFAGVIVFTKLAGQPSPILIALIIASIIIIYTVRGGYSAATLTDKPRLYLVIIGFTLLGALSVWAQVKNPNPLPNIFVDWASAVFFTLVPFHLSALDMWQRGVAAGGDVPSIQRGLIRSLPICILWLVPAYVGSLAASLGAHPTNVNYVVLNVFDYTAPHVNVWFWEYIFQPLIYGSLVATLASTGDSLLITMIFTFTYDIYGSFKKIDFATITPAQKRNLLSRSQYWTGVLGLYTISS